MPQYIKIGQKNDFAFLASYRCSSEDWPSCLYSFSVTWLCPAYTFLDQTRSVWLMDSLQNGPFLSGALRQDTAISTREKQPLLPVREHISQKLR